MTRRAEICCVAAAVACWGAGLSAAPLTLNLAQTLRDTKTMLASGQPADIVVLGDSLSFRPGTYLPTFTTLLQNRYGNAGAGYQGMSLWSGGGFNAGWLYTGLNTDNAPYHSLDGLWNRYDGVAPWPNQAIITPNGNNVQIQYLKQPGGGSFLVRRGEYGDVVANISTDGPTGIGTLYHTLAPEDTKYTIEPTGGGSFTILGHNNISPNSPGVRVHRAANGGWGVNNFLRRDWTFDRQLQLLGTDLVMVWIGQNDQAYTAATYQSAINLLVDRVQAAVPSAEVLLIGTYNQGSEPLAGLVEGMAQVAQSRGVGFINLYQAAGTPQFFQDNGYLDDGVHFSAAGGVYMGNLLYNAFVTNGRSIDPSLPRDYNPTFDPNELPIGEDGTLPEPGAATVLLFLSSVGLARRRRKTDPIRA